MENNYETMSLEEKFNMLRVESGDSDYFKDKVEKGSYDWHDEEILKVIKCDQKYVSDGIGESYKNWSSNTPILISAQTGSGKNEFIKTTLLKDIKESDSEILILVNRTAVNRQQKRIFAKAIDEQLPADYTDRELDGRETFGRVTIKTYQKLIQEMEENIKEDYKYVVLDECHFFTSDALFNCETYRLLKHIRMRFKNSIRIYMTATPDEVFGHIIESEKKLPILERTNRIANPLASRLCPTEIYCYEFERNYNYINPCYFDSKHEIINKINNDKSDEKWLIFVSSKKKGLEIANELGSKAVYVDASSKYLDGDNEATRTLSALNYTDYLKEYIEYNKDKNIKIEDAIESLKSYIYTLLKSVKQYDKIAYAELIKNQKFENKVLVATSVLDNGVNFKDVLLKNIVIMTSDKTSFLQMLGRKRIEDGNKVNMYIQKRKSDHFNGRLKLINQKLSAYYSSLGKKKPEFIVKTLEGKIDVLQICNLYKVKYSNIERDYEINWNELAIDKLIKDKKFIEGMIKKLDGKKDNEDAVIKLDEKKDEYAFIKEQLSWIGLDYDKIQYISNELIEKNKKEFEEFLYITAAQNKEFNKEEKEEFEKEFREKYLAAYGERGSDNSNRKSYGKNIISKVLSQLNLPFEMKNIATGKWKFIIVEKKE